MEDKDLFIAANNKKTLEATQQQANILDSLSICEMLEAKYEKPSILLQRAASKDNGSGASKGLFSKGSTTEAEKQPEETWTVD